jgi:Spx/MgsR family transcriptional regulator
MIKIYGIKNCDSVKKALRFFESKNLKYKFIDFKVAPVEKAKIKEWLSKTTIDILLNTKGTKYKFLKLKELNLDICGKSDWLAKENLLIKRPIVEFDDKLIVGFDEKEYEEIFGQK